VDLVRNLLAKDRPGRAILIHEALDAYSKIVDAMDDVTDDALTRKVDLKKGIAAVERLESDTLSTLRRIQESKPKDLDSYSFSLEQAIETASDSLDAARQDLGARAADVAAREEKEKRDREAAMAPADGSANKSADAKAVQKSDQKKAPTLMRPGEKKPDQ
jgi:peptidoglycan hydrolase CwlO-like protein